MSFNENNKQRTAVHYLRKSLQNEIICNRLMKKIVEMIQLTKYYLLTYLQLFLTAFLILVTMTKWPYRKNTL